MGTVSINLRIHTLLYVNSFQILVSDMNIKEIIALAIRAVRSNLLRTILTSMIIAIGIMALVGILTAMDSLTNTMSTNLSNMGANTFNIIRKGTGITGGNRKRKKKGPVITFDQAMEFKDRYFFPAKVSTSVMGTQEATLKSQEVLTDPNITIFGVDENYMEVAGYEIGLGRNITENDNNGRNVAILGIKIAKKLFKKEEKAIDAIISIGSDRYKVIGVLKEKGSSSAFNGDSQVFVPLMTAKRYYASSQQNYNLSVGVQNSIEMDNAIEEAMGLFRLVRRLKATEEEDFEISKSDSLVKMLEENTKLIKFATMFIGVITLFGAAIGLMNIMLVSVTERTREIGICKALGATSNSIMMQFLVEAITICQMGGFLGVVFGILIGNIVSFAMEGNFIIPWVWIFMGIVLCFIVGLISGLYPALKASRLDPIESLRYE